MELILVIYKKQNKKTSRILLAMKVFSAIVEVLIFLQN